VEKNSSRIGIFAPFDDHFRAMEAISTYEERNRLSYRYLRSLQEANVLRSKRDPFGLTYWIPGWARPFESLFSLYQKYAWINRATSKEHRWITDLSLDYCNERNHLDARLFKELPHQYRSSNIQLWHEANLPNAVCPICLQFGYWSELPQLAGFDQCPLHGIPLQRRCRKCIHPLKFGCPRFGQSGAFVCSVCGEQLTPFPANICQNWVSLPDEFIVSRFAHLDAIAQKIAFKGRGEWHIFGKKRTIDWRLILHALTGHRLHNDLESERSLFNYGLSERILPVTFVLPRDETILDVELMTMQRALIADIVKLCGHYGHSKPAAKSTTWLKTGFIEDELEFQQGGSLFDNIMSVLNTVWEEQNWMVRTSDYFSQQKMRGNAELLNLHRDQIFKILRPFAVWQVARILFLVENVATELMKRFSMNGTQNEQIGDFLDSQPFGIQLKWGRIDDRRFVFNTFAFALLPPFRILSKPCGIELTIYQIIPEI
jgi:hypothetical protein